MEKKITDFSALDGLKLAEDAFAYWVDSIQRSILFMDVIRKRGNIYLEHLKNGQPPVLIFDFRVILTQKQSKNNLKAFRKPHE